MQPFAIASVPVCYTFAFPFRLLARFLHIVFFGHAPDLLSLTELCASCTIALIMPDAQTRTERRSLRLWMSIPVGVSGKNATGKNFTEDTETTVVNAHGGLLFLYEPVKIGTNIALTNRATNEEQTCRVVSMRKASDKGMHVGIEFLLPSPNFWGAEFPPDNWPAA